MAPLSVLLAITTAHAVNYDVADADDLQAVADASPLADGDTITFTAYVTQAGSFDIEFNGDLEVSGEGWGVNTSLNFFGGNNDTLTVTGVSVAGNTNLRPLTLSTVNPANANATPSLVLENSEFIRNYAGAVSVEGGGTAELYLNTFEFNGNTRGETLFDGTNYLEIEGGALRFDGEELIVGRAVQQGGNPLTGDFDRFGNEFNNNSATHGGAIWVEADTVRVEANSFVGNIANDFTQYNQFLEELALVTDYPFATGDGGALHVVDSGSVGDVDIRWNNISSNWGIEGGAVFILRPLGGTDFNNNLVAQNWVLDYGGGLSIITGPGAERPRVVNNTLVANAAGLTRVNYFVQVIGGGGNARFDGIVPDFRGNVVTHAWYGGGVLGVVGAGDFEAGDNFNDYFQYDLYFYNCDTISCLDTGTNPIDFTGQFAQYASHPSNITGFSPEYIYFGDPREPVTIADGDAYPEVLCLTVFSPGINAGDPDLPNLDDSSYRSDLGHCAGPEAAYWNRDRDEDGWLQMQDCFDNPEEEIQTDDPNNPLQANEVYPEQEEVCDFVDNDCDGQIDETFPNKWWSDDDGDGSGAVNGNVVLTCDPSTLSGNYVSNADDCDDTNPLIFGGAQEICDQYDNDCDGIVNNGDVVDARELFPDNDQDGYFTDAPGTGKYVCEDADGDFYPASLINNDASSVYTEDVAVEGVNYGALGDDCRDGRPDINPGAPEQCSDEDYNCNGDPYDVPPGVAADQYYLDVDGDGWGSTDSLIVLCEGQELPVTTEGVYVANGGDCDETNAAINSGADEICDGLDNDCNQIIDDDPSDGLVKYEDYDNDGFGNPATALRACSHEATYTTSQGGDCDDNDPTVQECSECGCQAAPTSGSFGLMFLGLVGTLGLRRRR